MLRDRFQVLLSQARRLLWMLAQGGLGLGLSRAQTVVAAARRENLDSIYRDLSLPHARRLASLQAALRGSHRDRELPVNSARTQ